jgi:hypothetical protein
MIKINYIKDRHWGNGIDTVSMFNLFFITKVECHRNPYGYKTYIKIDKLAKIRLARQKEAQLRDYMHFMEYDD